MVSYLLTLKEIKAIYLRKFSIITEISYQRTNKHRISTRHLFLPPVHSSPLPLQELITSPPPPFSLLSLLPLPIPPSLLYSHPQFLLVFPSLSILHSPLFTFPSYPHPYPSLPFPYPFFCPSFSHPYPSLYFPYPSPPSSTLIPFSPSITLPLPLLLPPLSISLFPLPFPLPLLPPLSPSTTLTPSPSSALLPPAFPFLTRIFRRYSRMEITADMISGPFNAPGRVSSLF